MNWLTTFKRVTLVLIFAIFSVISRGQNLNLLDPEKPYSDTNPYIITSADDWNVFAADVNGGYGYSDEKIKLVNDITVNTMVGTDEDGFSGIFDGNSKTLTFNYSGDYYIAPFYDTYNATIKNLKVEGNITATGGYAAGLIYINYETTSVSNVTVSVNITATNQQYCAGFVVSNCKYDNPGLLTISNCVYDGQIKTGINSGGFWASQGDGITTYTNCLFKPAEGSVVESGRTFGKGSNFSSCYYTDELGTIAQGTKVYENPTDFIGKKVEAFPTYYKAVITNVTGVSHTYNYIENNDYYQSIIEACSVTLNGADATSGTDYELSITQNNSIVTEVINKGDYAVVISGKGNYKGTYKKDFYVIDGYSGGNGEESTPYIIACGADWIKFANDINAGINTDKYYKLNADITANDMVGTAEHPFSGHFSGRVGETYDLYTITFNYGTAAIPTNEEIIAPFRYTDGATIQYLKVSGAIHTNVGKEAGLIGVNTLTSTNTTVQRVIVDLNFYCYEALWYSEGGGFAYDGRGITFNACAYQGQISASNYHGGFCGNGDNSTSFENCLFNPKEGGIYWAQNFVYNKEGDTSSSYFSTCYYTEGQNQETSEQGVLVYVGTVPDESIGKKITTLYDQTIYKPVEVVVGGVNNTYIYTGEVITVTPTVTFDGENAISNNYCSTAISPSPVQIVGDYTLTITGLNAGEGHVYSGTKTKDFRVVNSSSSDWNALQALLSGSTETITLDKDYKAGVSDAALTIDRTVTINLNDHTIDRGLFSEIPKVDDPKVSGQVFRIGSGATVIINGPGIITGGNNVAENTIEHSEFSDGGGIWNMGSLTLNNVTVGYNKCSKHAAGTSRTARGGGIYSGIGSTLIIYGGAIIHNEAHGGGGGLYAEKNAKFSINENDQTYECNIQSNKSQDKGGGIRVDASGKPKAVIKKCNITYNNVELHNAQSASYGGGIHFDGGTLDLTDCEISNNNSTRYGGGIYQVNGTINAKDCQIMYNMSYDDENYYSGYGGGVCIMGGKFNMDGGMVYGNSSYIEKGGGVFVNTNTTFTLKGKVFVTGNWKYDNSVLEDKSTTNVYIMNKGNNGIVTILSGFDPSSRIGVAKNDASGWSPVFTKDLYKYNGTISNFVSDYDNYTIIRSDGNAKFSKPEPWNPDDPSDYTINDTWIVNTTINADYPITFGNDGCLIIVDEGENKHGKLTASITNTDSNKIVINGGELVTTSPNVAATSIKNVLGAVSYQNWYLISTPFNNPTITMSQASGTNLITHDGNGKDEYDLFRFNEATTEINDQGLLLYWENYRSTDPVHEGFSDNQPTSVLENGRGYLYRNENDYTAVTRGVLNVADIVYPLSYTETQTQTEQIKFKGFHIIGNPYSHNIYKNDVYQESGDKPAINENNLAVGYYRLVQGTGTDPDEWQLVPSGIDNPIRPMEGVLIQTKAANSTFTIANSTNPAVAVSNNPAKGGKSGYDNIMFEVTKGNNNDVACAMFCDGACLNKIERRNAENPMLYIRHNDEDCAIATMSDDVRAFDLNFKAKTMGQYILRVKPQGEFGYIYLYDKLTRKDVDMLKEVEYEFIGSQSDAANRFVVRLGPSTAGTDSGTFAYQSGDDIIVEGEGELQVFDVMGRMVATQHINGVQTVNGLNNGVFIFRMDGMTQKIVVR